MSLCQIFNQVKILALNLKFKINIYISQEDIKIRLNTDFKGVLFLIKVDKSTNFHKDYYKINKFINFIEIRIYLEFHQINSKEDKLIH